MKFPLIFILFLLFIISCEDKKSKNSSDADIVPDRDIVTDSDNLTDEDDDSEFPLNEEDEEICIPDNDLDFDFDEDTDSDVEPIPDAEYLENTYNGNEDCPPIKDAKYPYYHLEEGKTPLIHFCRKCDKPTTKDPQCMTNLWKEQELKLHKDHPEASCGLPPCQLDSVKTLKPGENENLVMNKCDRVLANMWNLAGKSMKATDMNNGKVVFSAYYVMPGGLEAYPSKFKILEYDIKEKKYMAKAVGNGATGYYNGGHFYQVYDARNPITTSATYYMGYLSKDGVYRLVYTEKVLSMYYQMMAFNDKWVFTNIARPENDLKGLKMSYAKVDPESSRWEWHFLTDYISDSGNQPQIVGDRLIFYNDKFEFYACDLDKTPKTLADCRKINRENERIRSGVMDEKNNNLIYFSNIAHPDKIMRVNLGVEPAVYEEFPIQNIDYWTIMTYPEMVKGNLMIYGNKFAPNNEESDTKMCYYRIDQKKSYCLKPVDQSSVFPDKPEKYAFFVPQFENHYLMWQNYHDSYVTVRDMECYCDRNPEICPFDDYTPNPGNPKEPFSDKRVKRR